MKNILLIGDSIRAGYDQYVKESLEGQANVFFPPENCRFAHYILRSFNLWIEDMNVDSFDVVHWNAGLWDTLRIYGDDCLTRYDDYIDTLNRIQSRIERLFPNAVSIFATSTPVRESGFITDYEMRYNADVERYNAAAIETLSKRGVIINDLYSLLKDVPDSYHSDQTHFYTAAATELIGTQVNSVICDALGIDKTTLIKPDATKFEVVGGGKNDSEMYIKRGNRYEKVLGILAMKYISDVDKEFIENKYHDTSKPFDPHQKFTYHGIIEEYSDGLDDEQMRAEIDRFYRESNGKDRALVKAKAFAFVLDNAKVSVSDKDYFPCLYNWGRPLDKPLIIKWIDELFEGIDGLNEQIEDWRAAGVADMWLDTCHVVPDWQDILSLGLTGMLERVRYYHGNSGELTKNQDAFFTSIEIEYEAILRLIDKIISYANEHKSEKTPLIVSALENIRYNPPKNTFEALMLMYVYFMCSESIDSYQVRSMGNGFDRALYKYYKSDIENGVFTRDDIKSFIVRE